MRLFHYTKVTSACTYNMYLLQFEDVFVEVLLQLLVGVVDAELLKGVLLEDFKAKYIKHSNRVSLATKIIIQWLHCMH